MLNFKENKIYIRMAIVYIVVITSAIATSSPILIVFSVVLTFIFLFFIYQSINGYDGHNSINWILPSLKLSAEIIKVDGDIGKNEVLRVEKYLQSEFTEKRAKQSIEKFREYLSKSYDIKLVCQNINRTNEAGERLQIIHFLVKLAVVDKFLSKKEEEFLKMIVKELRLSSQMLQSILSLHYFIYENDHKNQRKSKPKPSSSYRIEKAYGVLGLSSKASMEEAKKAYRELVKVYHPDKIKDKALKKNAKIQFIAITDAYETLKKKLG